MLCVVARVMLAVVDDDLPKIEGRDAFQAGGINAELIGVRTALMVGVNAAVPAEMMLRHPCVEAVGRQFVFAEVTRKSAGVEVTATAPRILQIEQVQRRAEAKPSVRVTVNWTAPQWQAPLSVIGSSELVSITPGLSAALP